MIGFLKKIFGSNETKFAQAPTPEEKKPVSQEKKAVSQEQSSKQGAQNKGGQNQGQKKQHNKPHHKKQHNKNGEKKHQKREYADSDNATPCALTPAQADNSWELPEAPVEEGKTAFLSMDVCPAVQRAIHEMDFKFCTPVQAGVLPHSVLGKDVAAKAQTGTGKTAAFLISMFDYFVKHPQTEIKAGTPRALILAPTRELALQIGQDALGLGKYCDIQVETFFGGMDFEKQAKVLRGRVDIAVATPGRLMDYQRRKMIDLSKVEFLVIDEADRMLDMGFIPDVRRIVNYLPSKKTRITQLYSATLSPKVLSLAESWLDEDFKQVEINPETIVSKNVTQKVYTVTADQKLNVTLWHLKNEEVSRMIIFANRKHDCVKLANRLHQHGIDKIELLTGDVAQKKRMRILEEFRSGKVNVLVATDVAGRGIHVDDVSHVINYELPYEPEDYVHRVGRTGRAEALGKAICFADENSGYELPAIEMYIEMALPCEVPPEGMTDAHEKVRKDYKFQDKRDDRRGGGGNRGGNRGGGHRGGGSRHQERSGGHHRGNRR